MGGGGGRGKRERERESTPLVLREGWDEVY